MSTTKRHTRKTHTATLLTTCAIIASGLIAISSGVRAGELDPPSGAVAPTGATLTEILDAIEGSSHVIAAQLAFTNIANVPGDATNVDHQGWIDTFAWRLKASREDQNPPLQTPGKPQYDTLSLLMRRDRSFTSVVGLFNLGNSIKTVQLDLVNTGGGMLFNELEVLLNDAVVTHFEPADENTYLAEFSFKTITLTHRPDPSLGPFVTTWTLSP